MLVQYWTTTSPAAKADMATLKEMWNKYGRSLAIVGVSLDNDVKDLNAYLGENPLPWPQIFEDGGLDSRPANALGILTIPTMILLDQEGKAVNRNVSTTELESEIKKLPAVSDPPGECEGVDLLDHHRQDRSGELLRTVEDDDLIARGPADQLHASLAGRCRLRPSSRPSPLSRRFATLLGPSTRTSTV